MMGSTALVVRLRRRQLLQSGLMAGITLLASCQRTNNSPILRAPAKSLPALWQQQLKAPWRIEALMELNTTEPEWLSATDLLALGDGWLSSLDAASFQPINADRLQAQLGPTSERFLTECPQSWQGKILPISVSPWVMLFRGEQSLLNQASQSWGVLLDPELNQKVLLPTSPRLVMSLATAMDATDALQRLRLASISFDDRHALNWLLQGDARVAVLPLQRCMAALMRDPRLTAVLPVQGAPLNWTVMLRPKSSKEPLPQDWVETAWQEPLLSRLLSAGWVPPLDRTRLRPALSRVPKTFQALVLPPEKVWQQCWNLAPLNPSEQDVLKADWKASTP